MHRFDLVQFDAFGGAVDVVEYVVESAGEALQIFRSKGVMKVLLVSLKIWWVISSPVCSSFSIWRKSGMRFPDWRYSSVRTGLLETATRLAEACSSMG